MAAQSVREYSKINQQNQSGSSTIMENLQRDQRDGRSAAYHKPRLIGWFALTVKRWIAKISNDFYFWCVGNILIASQLQVV